MGYTNKTSHYDLPQWIAGDKPSWLGDMNTAMLNIDSAIAGADASASAAENSAAAANAQVQAQEPKITKNTADIQALTEQLAEVSGVANSALPKNGGTMTGPLTLSGGPTQDLQAATKQYVDTNGVGESVTAFTHGPNASFGQCTGRYNKAAFQMFLSYILDSSFTETFAVESYTYIPVGKCTGNPFKLPTKVQPTTTNDIRELMMGTDAKLSGASGTIVVPVAAYFDGTYTKFCLKTLTTQVSQLGGANCSGNNIFEVC